MAEPDEQFKSALQLQHYSLTKARLHIFRALQDKEPQTMHEVVTRCIGNVDRASVYRTISLFERIGIVQRLQIGWKYKLELSDAFHHHHHHLTCSHCGKTIPLPEDDKLEKRLQILSEGARFIMDGHQLEIQGVCYQCSHKS